MVMVYMADQLENRFSGSCNERKKILEVIVVCQIAS